MTAVLSNNLRVYNAQRFVDSLFSGTTDRIYLTIGKPTSWSVEATPPNANTSTDAANEVWRYMIGAKRITGSDVRHAVRRYDWVSGGIYAAYDSTIDSETLQNIPFYVLTDDWNVYKCLSNNSGKISTVKPTSTLTTSAVETSDNYIWKYLYSLSAEERLRFLTPDYMPIKTLTTDNGSLQWQVQSNARDGALEAAVVVNSGTGYRNANTIVLSVAGDGTGANAVARINSTSNTISTVVFTNPGTGYSFASISISDSSGGANGVVRPVISPNGGHGSDPLRELGGGNVIINARIRGNENGKFPIDNEFRQIALIQNPIPRGSSNVASNSTYTQVTTITLDSGSTAYLEDEIVYQGASLALATFKGTVVSWNDTTSVMGVIDSVGTLKADVLNGVTSRAARLVQSITQNDLKPFSGDLLYIENIAPIQRATDQTEDFKIVIKF